MIHVTKNVDSSTVVSLSGYSEKDSPTATGESSRTSLPIMKSDDSDKAIELEKTAISEKQIDLEKAMACTVEEVNGSTIETLPGRPNISALMESLIDNCDPTKRAIVGACGPGGLLETVKSTESQCIRPEGPSFTLHTEVG